MLGGIDLIIDGPPSPGECDFLARSIRSEWPDAMFEDVEAPGKILPLGDVIAAGKTFTEAFFYRDRAAYELAEEEGVTESSAPGLLHFVSTPNQAALVAHVACGQALELAESLARAIERQRWFALAPRIAA